MFFGSMGKGYTDALGEISNRGMTDAEKMQMLNALARSQSVQRGQAAAADPLAQAMASFYQPQQGGMQLPPMPQGGGQMPPPQAPMPGQPSVPMMPPPPAGQGAGPAPVQPYTAPSAPQPQSAAGGAGQGGLIPPPPAGAAGGTPTPYDSLQRGPQAMGQVAQQLLQQGLQGEDLFNALTMSMQAMGGMESKDLAVIKAAYLMQHGDAALKVKTDEDKARQDRFDTSEGNKGGRLDKTLNTKITLEKMREEHADKLAKLKAALQASGGHYTMAEEKAAGNVITMVNANEKLDSEQFRDMTLPFAAMVKGDKNGGYLATASDIARNTSLTPEQRVFAQLNLQYIEGATHLKSGARITPDTARMLRDMYVGVDGDDPDTLARKQEARDNDIEAGKIMGGRAYKAYEAHVAEAGQGGAAPAAAGPKAEPKRIKNDADYNALPSGAEFITPDGQHKRKR